MRFGLSTTVNDLEFRQLTGTSKDIEKLYLRYINLAVNFALKCGFKIIEVFSYLNNGHEVLPPILKQIKDKIKVFDEVSFHAPLRLISIRAMKECILIGKKLGAKKIVLHPDYLPVTPDRLLPSQRILRNKPEEMLKLISFCKKHGLIPCLENMPSEMPKYNRPEEFDFS